MELDYSKLGLRAGLEIHQQLDSGTKLFCRCPIPEKRAEEFPLHVERHLRPAAGELDVVDPAAIYEFLRNKKFIYRYNHESACLLELDEKPPEPANYAALETALKIAKMLQSSVVDEIYVMRKTVIDGSAVSGFQRTALVAVNGSLDTSFGRIRIPTISLEEDASTPIKKEKCLVEYRLDRLGIPLIEIGTSADMHTPQQVKEVALLIGTLLRSFPVIRGIGSIRQDVNISIAEGARVEIKGFQQLDEIPALVENEVLRQIALVHIKNELHHRGLKNIDEKSRDVTDIFKSSGGFISKVIRENGKVFALKLPNFAGLLAEQCGDRTFGKELAGYVEAFGFGGIIHSDEDLNEYSLTREFSLLKKELAVGEQDLVLILAGRENMQQAINMLVERAKQCLTGVPEETRVADGIGSKYTRPLPGSGRLYPESDLQPVVIDRSYLQNLKLPKTLEQKKSELDIPEQLAEQIVKSKYYGLFIELKEYDATLAATIFLSTYKDMARRGYDVSKIKKEDLEKILAKTSDGSVPKNAIDDILVSILGGRSVDSVLSEYYMLSSDQLHDLVLQAINENPSKSDSAIIGIVLAKSKGRADGKKIAELLKELRK